MTKILVIDDELEICKQISLILSKQGYEVTYANSYKEFVELEHVSNSKLDKGLIASGSSLPFSDMEIEILSVPTRL